MRARTPEAPIEQQREVRAAARQPLENSIAQRNPSEEVNAVDSGPVCCLSDAERFTINSEATPFKTAYPTRPQADDDTYITSRGVAELSDALGVDICDLTFVGSDWDEVIERLLMARHIDIARHALIRVPAHRRAEFAEAVRGLANQFAEAESSASAA